MLTYYNYRYSSLHQYTEKWRHLTTRVSGRYWLLKSWIIRIFVFATERPCTKLFYIRGLKGKSQLFTKFDLLERLVMLLNLFRHFSKFHSRSSVIFIWKSLISRFWRKPYMFFPILNDSNRRLWNKDFIRILQRTYKPILSACFPLKTA